MKKELLVATHNQGKVAEFREMLADLLIGWKSLGDVQVSEDVEENGASFEANAILKAKSYAAKTGMITLADDSGLQVDALGGDPGIYTARYGGEDLSHQQRYQLLLRNLAAVPWEQRTARFRCVIALANANGDILGTAEGVCEGMIAMEPAGSGGFGYDPVFYLPERAMTMAEVGSAVKHQISHRGQALKAMEPLLREVLRAGV